MMTTVKKDGVLFHASFFVVSNPPARKKKYAFSAYLIASITERLRRITIGEDEGERGEQRSKKKKKLL